MKWTNVLNGGWVPALFLVFQCPGTAGQKAPARDPAARDQILRDTLMLEDVTISVLPFLSEREEAAGGYSYLDISSLEETPPIEPSEVYNRIPGVHMVSGNINTNRLVIRGVGSRTPYNTNRIRAYLDDIPLTSGDGISSLEDLDLLGIGSIEVLKGPSSALYGSGLGGVVRLSSPYPEKYGFSVTLKGEFGSYQTGRAGSLLSYKAGPWALVAGAVRSVSDGYRENSQYTRTNLFLNARRFGLRHTFSMTLAFISLNAGIPSSLSEEDYRQRPWTAAANWLNVEGYESYSTLHSGAKLESRLGPAVTNHLILFSTFSDPYESRPFNILDDRSLNAGFREYIQAEKGRGQIRTGVEGFGETYDWKLFETLQGVQGDLLSHQSEKRQYMNFFLAGQWRAGKNWILNGGLNTNILTYKLHTLFRSDSLDNSGQYRYPPVLSPRAGISYRHHSSHYLYASAGHGFSPPSLEETLLPEGTVNTGLKPETGWNLELGNRGTFRRGMIRYDLALYSIFLDNLLVTERITEDIFTGANAGMATLSGFEAWAQYRLRPDSTTAPFNAIVTVGYTLSDHRFTDFVDDGVDFSGNRLPGIPVQQMTSTLQLLLDPIRLGLHYQFTGNQWMEDANTRLYSSYHLLSVQAGCSLGFTGAPFVLDLNAGIRNILNTHYASMILVNAPSFGGSAPRYYYPGTPRHFRLSMTVTFK